LSYIELHAASAFSFLDGASLPEALIGACRELEMPSMALLDRDGVYGSARFHLAGKKAAVRAHVGTEISMMSGCALPVLALNRTGYQNLCRLLTQAKLRAPKGTATVCEDDLLPYAEGLVCLTGGEHGPLPTAIRNGGVAEGLRAAERLVEIFGRDRVYIELQRHFLREEEAVNQRSVEIARALQLPLLATNGVRYTTTPEREILDVFTCLRNYCTLETAGRLLARNAESCLKTPREMERIFSDLPEAIANTTELSSRLEFTLEDLGYEFPRYPVPDGETMASFLRKLVDDNARQRYRPYEERHRKQIERELRLIEKLSLEGYFLIVWDIVQFCRRNNILVQGRGSAANSAVCYVLGITAVDPVGMELLFERFLSEERGEWPDIDLDLPSGDQRERAIQYVYQRYGPRGAAMTANVITYRGRSAAREAGKVLGFDTDSIGRLSRLAGHWEYKDSLDTLQGQFASSGFDLRHPRVHKFLELCLGLQDLPRHLGQHSGGMIVCQGQLDSVVPLEPATMPGRTVVQWDKDDCADMGIIKVDLLGLGMMAVLEDSIQLIRQYQNEDVDLAHLPADDPKTYNAIQKADTVGMFQIESRAQMACLPRMRPDHFYDLVVEVAIIRPGPIVGKMVHPYLNRRQGREPLRYPHPALEPVLKRTLGVPLFQEQLLRMAMITAGFSGGQAEELRRAFGFKRSERRMAEIETKLRAGMTANGIKGNVQDEIIQSITSFALYGFPESHAASFALIAYASAYLKCHYLAAFTAAILNNQPMGFYSPATLVKDAQRHGLKARPVDVMRSDWECTLEEMEAVPSYTGKKNSTSAEEGVWTKSSSRNAARPPESGGQRDRDEVEIARGEVPELHQHRVRLETSPRATLSGRAALLTQEGVPLSKNELFVQNPLLDQGAGISGTSKPNLALRIGLRYVRGLHEAAGHALVRARAEQPFTSIDDLVLRVPELRKDELVQLAEIGALNFLEPDNHRHRRDALWQVERSAQRTGPLLEKIEAGDESSPLDMMTPEERLIADFGGTGMTIGPHPMAYCRKELHPLGILRASDLAVIPNGQWVRVAGCVIARQRPGTAKGFVFLSLEDETGIANIIVTPDVLEQNRATIIQGKFLLFEGPLQNVDNVIHVKAARVEELTVLHAAPPSRDFH
jgi:error-prone DNA polymerase